ncbi:hypothetical protein AA0535_0063 [Asaia krungthepensis NRIC 0535]|uniref:Uncharacterized protein n=1 Tax=Asaia krungthepensis NRIC 0535 TaxID=1307925 RepID=A0ABQ0PVM2_9PROT|nr:hypothetical protein AA0535_0063 [Asaia krungthepensis NRIC 0535]
MTWGQDDKVPPSKPNIRFIFPVSASLSAQSRLTCRKNHHYRLKRVSLSKLSTFGLSLHSRAGRVIRNHAGRALSG